MVTTDISKYKDLFLSEAKEHLKAMNKSLLKLERSPGKLELINNIFRETHSLKSMAATMDYNDTARLCHAMEDVLDGIKKKKIKPDKCIDIIFNCFDTLEVSIKEISKGREELDTDMLVKKLEALFEEDQRQDKSKDKSKRVENGTEDSFTEKVSSIEVKVERLDTLMNLAEELLINKMRLDIIKEEHQNPELTAAIDTLGRFVDDLQYNVMQSRMVPMGFVFNRFPRMVRDLAKKQRKEINLHMEGSDIELDRAVIDEIGEGLVHILRNAVDHGIETPEKRRKVGKPAQGNIKLTAREAKNFAIIQIADDGAGLDEEDIRKIASKKKILSPTATREEIIGSIFSGISTTKQVSAVSGRGFGLNIVKEKIDSVGGTIKVKSESRKGTTFEMKIPLTLAIIKALFVIVESKIYAIPLASVDRIVSVRRQDIKGMLDDEAIILNKEELPIIRLGVLFGLLPSALDKQPIVIVQDDKEKFGLAVDALMNVEEIVIKPLNKLVRENKYFSGCTITGSGEVVLILDVANLMSQKITQIDKGDNKEEVLFSPLAVSY